MKTNNDKIDKITMDVPLFIRMLEYAREDAKDDMDLHTVTEKILKLSRECETLTMSNYHSIAGNEEETNEQTMTSSSGAFDTSLSTPLVKGKINKIHNMNETEHDMAEATDASSSGAYDVPLFSGSNRKNPLSIGGEKTIKQSRAVKDKNFPKWGGPNSVYVKIKDKCKKYPYCNQGDKGALEMLEITELNESITRMSLKYNIPQKNVENLVLTEVNKIITENIDNIRNSVENMYIKLNDTLDKQKVSRNHLKYSLEKIGNGTVKYNNSQDSFKYEEELSNNIKLVVYGHYYKDGYEYEIKVISGEKDLLLNVDYNTNIKTTNANVISILCTPIKKYFTSEVEQ